MTETRIEAQQDGGVLDGLLLVPEPEGPHARGPWPLVVMYMDAFGLRPALSAMARRLTARGYAVVQPNLYWRAGPYEPFDAATAFRDPSERERLMKLMHGLQPEQAMADTRSIVSVVGADDARIRTERVGVVGYCMGGRVAFISAERVPERVIAAACIHPGGLVTAQPDSPHRDVAHIRGTIYIAAADEDSSFTPEQREILTQALDAAHVAYELELFVGARHGFAVPDHAAYNGAAAEQQWERVFALFDRTVRPEGSPPPSRR
jgi:carboxymethylenebutenolidase